MDSIIKPILIHQPNPFSKLFSFA